MDFYEQMRSEFSRIIAQNHWESEPIQVNVRTLTPEEAIGNPEHRDYPLIKGRERMMEADFRGAQGQAFTDMFGAYSGTLLHVARMELEESFGRAVFIACLNAVLRYLGVADKTIHCKDESPPVCAQQLASQISEQYGRPKIAVVGLQPRMVDTLAKRFEIRVTDMDEDNIGQTIFGTLIQGPEHTPANLAWCDLALVTGSTLTNATLRDLLTDKPTIVYGVTVAGPAVLLKLNRFCPYGL